MADDRFSIKIDNFEGPLDLLLELVTKRKLFVNDVSLAKVADDFIKYIEIQEAKNRQFPIEEAAEFIVIASTLMLIKSRSLLPGIKLTEEEEGSIQDLEKRLALYAEIKKLAADLGKIFGKEIIFEKTPPRIHQVTFSPDRKTNIKELFSALNSVLETLPRHDILPKATVKKIISLEEMIQRLAERVARASRFGFRDFHAVRGKMTRDKKISIIVSFLAMLELVKRGVIRVSQEGRGEIEIESEVVGVPSYS